VSINIFFISLPWGSAGREKEKEEKQKLEAGLS